MKYNVIKEWNAYDGYLKVKKAIIQHDLSEDNSSTKVEREAVYAETFALYYYTL